MPRSPIAMLLLLAWLLPAAAAAQGPDRALQLGDSAYIDFGDPGDAFDLVPGRGFTLMLWLRLVERPATHARVFSKRHFARPAQGYELCFVETSTLLSALVDATGRAEGAAAAPEEDRTTVLVVDDNPDVRAYVRSVLEPPYRVIQAADGVAGPARARAALPDLIVADVMMPEMDGLALGRALKSDPMTDAIPLLLLTARAAPEDQVAGLEAGADGYLVKPFEPAVLEARIANLLAQRRLLRERFRRGEIAPPPPPSPPPRRSRRSRPSCARRSRRISPTRSSVRRTSPRRWG